MEATYTEQEKDDLKYMQETGRGVMAPNTKQAKKEYAHLLADGLIYYDNWSHCIRLKTKNL